MKPRKKAKLCAGDGGCGQNVPAALGDPTSWRLTVPAAALIVLATVAAYHNGLGGPFVYDDITSIERNQTICQFWPLGPVLSPPCDGETVGGRPLLNLSLAINYAIGGLGVRGYHVTNLAIHVAAALLLFGILRRTFLTAALCDRFGRAATPLAFASALLWAVHPLQTESVTYIVQRAESLAGLLYLLTLYCLIRGAGTVPFFAPGTVPFFAAEKPIVPSDVVSKKGDCPPSPPQTDAGETPALHGKGEKGDCPPRPISWLWYAAAVLACLAGMACKEVMVTAPLVVLLYDRTFLAGSFREALRRRWGLYLGLAATWGLLAYLTFSTTLIFRQEQMGAPDWWSYARTQPGVILLYLRLSAWPYPLCFDYAWPVADTLWEILPGALVVGLLLAATLWGLVRRRAWGFLGAWFLLILAPTSSVLPLGQLAFEHRMYLSLAAVMVPVVAGGYALWDRWTRRSPLAPHPSPLTPRPSPLASRPSPLAPRPVRWAVPAVVWAAVAAALGCVTVWRNSDYQTLTGIYQDTVNKRPDNPVAQFSLGSAFAAMGRTDEAIAHYQRALQLKPDFAAAHYNLGNALSTAGRMGEAIEQYQHALRLKFEYLLARNNLANALSAVGRTDEAIAQFREALRLKPDYAQAHYNLGTALVSIGAIDEAIAHYRQAVRWKPDFATAHNNLGLALVAVGRTEEAMQHYHEALRLKSDYAEAHYNLGLALAGSGRTAEAIEHYQQALRQKLNYAEAHNNLGLALARAGRTAEAIEHYQAALRLKPDYAKAYRNLGDILLGLGKTDEAIQHYQQALRWQPNDPEVHNNLGGALAAAGKNDEAIEHYRAALRLKPDYADVHNNLGALLAGTGRNDEAIELYRAALRLKPDYADAQYNLGLALAAAGKTSEAIGHFQRLLQRTPDSVKILNQLAWLLATGGPAEGGDPGRAVRLAERARELAGPQNIPCLDTLAAAYAAAGRFADAASTAEQAVQLAESSGQASLVKRIQARLELYRNGQPYREPPRSPGP